MRSIPGQTAIQANRRKRGAQPMRYMLFASLAALAAGSAAVPGATPAQAEWAVNATAIEACSCPMFCQCYFNTKPAAHATAAEHSHHGGTHFCRANLAYKIN